MKDLKITAVAPRYAIPGGEIDLDCIGFDAAGDAGSGVFIGGEACQIVGASSRRILTTVPETVAGGETSVHIETRGRKSGSMPVTIGQPLASEMHIVANPAVDPADDALILTRSGSRGQHLPVTLFRLEPDGFLDEMPEPILNPTGIAFDREGQMFVTNRAQGEVYTVGRDGTATVYASGLGIATGIAFDADGVMFVGDRSGTIYRVRDFADTEAFAVMEPSVAAYHMAFGPDGRLYVTAPGLSSHDAILVIDREGAVTNFFRGLGRPQGLAFDKNGNLYCAGCYQGRHGIVKIAPDGSAAEHFVAGPNVVGLCFTRKGEMIVATGETVYSIDCGIEGTLL
jgi:sugar lactone lactonase YvrE